MNTVLGRYANEMISLTVMLLMASALVAGRAGAAVHAEARSDTGYERGAAHSRHEALKDKGTIRADIVIEVGVDGLVSFGLGTESREVLFELIDRQLQGKD